MSVILIESIQKIAHKNIIMTIKLFELSGSDPERRFSPYCWAIRMALAHKGLDVQTIPWRFMDKEVLAPSGQSKVPVLVHGDKWLFESWDIANYLEQTFPDRPTLFGGPQGTALSKFYCNFAVVMASQAIRMILVDIYDHLTETDKPYFRESREQRFGMSLEQVVADRESKLQPFRDGLMPLRMTLKQQEFFGGDQPLYADYALFGVFQWARCISPFQLLAADDPVALWRTRLLNAFNGLAQSAPGYD
jgi:glutathione S-transferase